MERIRFVWPFDLQYVLNSEFEARFSPLVSKRWWVRRGWLLFSPYFILLLFAALLLWGCGALAA